MEPAWPGDHIFYCNICVLIYHMLLCFPIFYWLECLYPYKIESQPNGHPAVKHTSITAWKHIVLLHNISQMSHQVRYNMYNLSQSFISHITSLYYLMFICCIFCVPLHLSWQCSKYCLVVALIKMRMVR